MSDSQRLYYGQSLGDDPLACSFEATVVRHDTRLDAPTVVLDRTAFYPESGGQMADRGRLGCHDVLDVQLGSGSVHHVLDISSKPLPAVGSAIHGEVDRARRRVHMALHTGQHILSRALIEVAQADTVSARLGETSCTIDVDQAQLADGLAAKAEDLTNAVIDDDVSVRAYFPDQDELQQLALRKSSTVAESIRVVCVGDFDVTPCGGTHCTSSAQVGLLRITAIERHKKRVRVSFAAGKRARTMLGNSADTLQLLSQAFSCGLADVPAAVDKLRRELRESREQTEQLRGHLAEQLALSLRASGDTVVAAFDNLPLTLLREVARRLTSAPSLVALLAAVQDDGVHVVMSRGEVASLDCGALMKRAAEACGGRGGGRPERAEGRLPAGTDWPLLAARLVSSSSTAD